MDEIQHDTKPLSDDQDLAKALAGITEIEDSADMDFTGSPNMNMDINAQIAATEGEAVEVNTPPANPTPTPPPATAPATPAAPQPVTPPAPTPEVEAIQDIEIPELPSINENPTASSDLDPIKAQALEELRPLIGKLDLPPEEKFETYLLLIRSSDDKELIKPAHETAKQITDETKRGEALLDIIKEIEYLTNPDD